MPNQLLFDNWTLQDVKEVYLSGLSNDSASKLIIDKKNDSHAFKDIPKGFIQIEALFSLLQNIVLRDTLIVDDRFTSTWDQNQKLKTLKNHGLIKGHRFKVDKFYDVRKAIIKEACVTKSIAEIQKKNEEHFQKEGEPFDPFMSQLIWGGAGMLARSHVYKTFYIPHPLRRHAFKQTSMPSRDAVEQTINVIQSSRTKLFQYQDNLSTGNHASFSLPPLIIKIIEESNDVDDLIKIALQLRDEYDDLRSWIKQFQLAIEEDNPKNISKFSKTLKSVQENIESKFSPNKYGTLSLEFDLLNLSIGVSLSISSNWIRNKFGIRSTLNDLILSQSGMKSLEKLFKLFDEKNSSLSHKIMVEMLKSFKK